MFDASTLHAQASAFASGLNTVEEFAHWFEAESKNRELWADRVLVAAADVIDVYLEQYRRLEIDESYARRAILHAATRYKEHS